MLNTWPSRPRGPLSGALGLPLAAAAAGGVVAAAALWPVATSPPTPTAEAGPARPEAADVPPCATMRGQLGACRTSSSVLVVGSVDAGVDLPSTSARVVRVSRARRSLRFTLRMRNGAPEARPWAAPAVWLSAAGTKVLPTSAPRGVVAAGRTSEVPLEFDLPTKVARTSSLDVGIAPLGRTQQATPTIGIIRLPKAS